MKLYIDSMGVYKSRRNEMLYKKQVEFSQNVPKLLDLYVGHGIIAKIMDGNLRI